MSRASSVPSWLSRPRLALRTVEPLEGGRLRLGSDALPAVERDVADAEQLGQSNLRQPEPAPERRDPRAGRQRFLLRRAVVLHATSAFRSAAVRLLTGPIPCS